MDQPTLDPGETLRFHAPGIKGAVARSGPTFRATVSVPVIQELELFITDRRIIVRAELFLGLFETDYVAWFPDAIRPSDADVLTTTTVSVGGAAGPHITFVARTGRPSLLRGPELTLALYFADAAKAGAALPPGLVR